MVVSQLQDCLPVSPGRGTAPLYFVAQRDPDSSHSCTRRRYAGLFFCICVDSNDNELAYLEAIHLFVEVLGQSLVAGARPLAQS